MMGACKIKALTSRRSAMKHEGPLPTDCPYNTISRAAANPDDTT